MRRSFQRQSSAEIAATRLYSVNHAGLKSSVSFRYRRLQWLRAAILRGSFARAQLDEIRQLVPQCGQANVASTAAPRFFDFIAHVAQAF